MRFLRYCALVVWLFVGLLALMWLLSEPAPAAELPCAMLGDRPLDLEHWKHDALTADERRCALWVLQIHYLPVLIAKRTEVEVAPVQPEGEILVNDVLTIFRAMLPYQPIPLVEPLPMLTYGMPAWDDTH